MEKKKKKKKNSIDLECCRLPTVRQRSRQQSGQITLQSVLINEPEFVTATLQHAEVRKIEAVGYLYISLFIYCTVYYVLL